MKVQNIKIFICLVFLTLLGGLFSPAVNVQTNFKIPETSSNSTFFYMLLTSFERDNFNLDMISFLYPIAIIITMTLLLIISYFKHYEWLFTLGFVFLVFTCSCLYGFTIKMNETKEIYFNLTYGFGWILYIMVSGVLTLYGLFFMINSNQEKT